MIPSPPMFHRKQAIASIPCQMINDFPVKADNTTNVCYILIVAALVKCCVHHTCSHLHPILTETWHSIEHLSVRLDQSLMKHAGLIYQ